MLKFKEGGEKKHKRHYDQIQYWRESEINMSEEDIITNKSNNMNSRSSPIVFRK